MSAGKFTKGKYQTNGGIVVPIRVQPETLSATLGQGTNSSVTGEIVPGYPRATISRSKRSVGIHARSVTLRFTGATPPTGYAAGETYRIPVMSPTVWNALGEGVSATYLGAPAEVVSTSPEKIR